MIVRGGTPPLADQAARDRARTAHGRPLAVEAGAGTGKTSLMVARILDGVTTGALRLDRLAAITFTRRAAGELKSRLRARLAELIPQAAGEERARLAAAAAALPRAQVSTVHAFCARILRENAVAAGLDPNFGAPDDGDPDAPIAELWEEWAGQWFADSGRPTALAEVIGWGARLDTLRDIALILDANPDCDPAPLVEGPAPEALWDGWLGQLSAWLVELRAMNRKPDKLLDGLAHAVGALERLAPLPADARLRFLAGLRNRDGVRFPNLTLSVGARSNYADPARFDAIKADFKALCNESGPRQLDAVFAPIAARALAELARFRAWARDARRERGTLGFTDQLYEVRRLLEDDAVRARVRAGLDALLVDEFQDTDPLMADIFDLLARPPRPLPVFYVGDPKQSIYRFRRADVQTYMSRVGALEQAGALERITVNFRCTAPMIQVINTVFRGVFDPSTWAQQARWDDLVPAPPPPEPVAAGASTDDAALVIVPAAANGDGEPDAEITARLEAEALARELQFAHDAGVPWRRMAVLFKAATRNAQLEETFDARGIPYRQEKSQRFFQRIEVAELAQTLSAVADPTEPLFVVAALRTRLFGFSDRELLEHRDAGGTFAPLAPGARGNPDVLKALRTLAAWHEESWNVDPPALLQTVLDDTRFAVFLAATGDHRGAANVLRALDRARTRWDAGLSGFAEFAHWLRTAVVDEDSREAESPAAAEEDRVALLTIHGAKGLEWDVVGLYGLTAKGMNRSDAALVSRESRTIEARFATGVATTRYDAVAGEDAQLDEAERARLAYVALTRAKRRVVLPLVQEVKPDSRSLLASLQRSGTFETWCDVATTGVDPIPGVVVTRPLDEVAPPTEVEHEHGHGLAPEAPRADATAIVAARASRGHFDTVRRELLAAGDRAVVTTPSALHGEWVPIEGLPPLAHGREIGRAVHLALEWIASGTFSASDADAEAAARRASVVENLDADDVERAVEFVRRAAANPLFTGALAADWRAAEYRVVWHGVAGSLDAETRRLLDATRASRHLAALADHDVVVIEGTADFVAAAGGALKLIDYKTDPWRAPGDIDTLAARYRAQVQAYRLVLRAVHPELEPEAWLLFAGGAGRAAEAKRVDGVE